MSEQSTKFVYVTYIRSSRQQVWDALTRPEFQKQYWFGMHQETDWKPGSPWKLVFEDGRVADAGEVLECDPPNRLVLRWRNEFKPEFKAEGYTRCAMSLEFDGELTKLTIDHSIERDNARVIIDGVSGGWPKVLSSLKSLLETGAALERFRS